MSKQRSTDRFIVEATWSGYTPAQAERIRHRTVEPRYKADLVDGYVHRFGDGTCLFVKSRPALPRERVSEIHSYDGIISDAWMAEAQKRRAIEAAK